jgi:hypothetical protein
MMVVVVAGQQPLIPNALDDAAQWPTRGLGNHRFVAACKRARGFSNAFRAMSTERCDAQLLAGRPTEPVIFIAL